MKRISTLEELAAYVESNPTVRLDAETLERVPLEMIEQYIMTGKTLLIPETEEEARQSGREALGEVCRRVAKKRGWKAAARHILSMTGQMMTGRKLASYARFLRKKFER